jgi:hypothetical protein
MTDTIKIQITFVHNSWSQIGLSFEIVVVFNFCADQSVTSFNTIGGQFSIVLWIVL